MEKINHTQTINIPTQFHSLVYNELSTMPLREVYLIWEMIKVMKQTHRPVKENIIKQSFDFKRSQTILKNLNGSLANDIINIEREDRV